ncbi:Stp1/IreP family PP2C-type Ser/Thr phosphatase [Haliangium sp.]|uniref:Stp1/IreP family PP2C-type Ser/Thr phosphatase n=1 Tax=Haliangium sp. TaxID=2663208 RepID=UPI003D13A888
MRYQAYGKTDAGRVRNHNEDYYLLDHELGLYVVCDGMGGHAAGEVASELAAHTVNDELHDNAAILRRYAAKPTAVHREQVRQVLHHAVQAASEAVWSAGGRNQERVEDSMGTTLAMLLVCGRFAFVVHVGDSRVYLLREGCLHQLTEDHSLVNEMVKQGLVAQEKAHSYPFANLITRAIGLQPEVEIDILHIEMMNGDRYLLCSDGLTNHAGPNELLEAIRSNELDQLSDVLVFMANEAGGSDNITAVVVGIGDSATERTLEHSDFVARKIETLQALPLFASIDYGELVKMLEIIELKAVEQGEIILREGDTGESMYIILDGAADVYKREQPINHLGPGDFFGELSLIDEVPRSATVVAGTRMTLLVLDRQPMFALLERIPRTAAKIYWAFLGRMSKLVRQKDIEIYRLNKKIALMLESATDLSSDI